MSFFTCKAGTTGNWVIAGSGGTNSKYESKAGVAGSGGAFFAGIFRLAEDELHHVLAVLCLRPQIR